MLSMRIKNSLSRIFFGYINFDHNFVSIIHRLHQSVLQTGRSRSSRRTSLGGDLSQKLQQRRETATLLALSCSASSSLWSLDHQFSRSSGQQQAVEWLEESNLWLRIIICL